MTCFDRWLLICNDTFIFMCTCIDTHTHTHVYTKTHTHDQESRHEPASFSFEVGFVVFDSDAVHLREMSGSLCRSWIRKTGTKGKKENTWPGGRP